MTPASSSTEDCEVGRDPVRLAPHGRRSAALVIDSVYVAAPALVFLIWTSAVDWDHTLGAWLAVLLLLTAVSGAVNGTLAWLTSGSTVGKAYMGLRTRRRNEGAIGLGVSDGVRMWLRYSIGYIVIDVFYIGGLWALRSPRRRAVHDVMFDTEVVTDSLDVSPGERLRQLEQRRRSGLEVVRERWLWPYRLAKWTSWTVMKVGGAAVVVAHGLRLVAPNASVTTPAASSVGASTGLGVAGTAGVAGASAALFAGTLALAESTAENEEHVAPAETAEQSDDIGSVGTVEQTQDVAPAETTDSSTDLADTAAAGMSLHEAVRAREPANVLRELIEDGADPARVDDSGEAPLHLAAAIDHVDAIEVLVEAGADPVATDHRGRTPLHSASAGVFNTHDAIAELLESGAAIDAADVDGNSPLHLAVRASNRRAVVPLVEAGADVNAVNQERETPLHIGPLIDRRAIIDALLVGGADVDLVDSSGQTPLHRAVRRRKLDAVQALVAAGAALSPQDDRGNTPLHDAAINPINGDVVRYLLGAGADTSVENNKGRTPEDVASASNAGLFDS